MKCGIPWRRPGFADGGAARPRRRRPSRARRCTWRRRAALSPTGPAGRRWATLGMALGHYGHGTGPLWAWHWAAVGMALGRCGHGTGPLWAWRCATVGMALGHHGLHSLRRVLQASAGPLRAQTGGGFVAGGWKTLRPKTSRKHCEGTQRRANTSSWCVCKCACVRAWLHTCVHAHTHYLDQGEDQLLQALALSGAQPQSDRPFTMQSQLDAMPSRIPCRVGYDSRSTHAARPVQREPSLGADVVVVRPVPVRT